MPDLRHWITYIAKVVVKCGSELQYFEQEHFTGQGGTAYALQLIVLLLSLPHNNLVEYTASDPGEVTSVEVVASHNTAKLTIFNNVRLDYTRLVDFQITVCYSEDGICNNPEFIQEQDDTTV